MGDKKYDFFFSEKKIFQKRKFFLSQWKKIGREKPKEDIFVIKKKNIFSLILSIKWYSQRKRSK